MANQEKIATVAELKEQFENSGSVILTEYRGLTVSQVKNLRRSLGADTKYVVVKNTLAKIAANQAGINIFDEDLKGPSAIAFIKGDIVEVAKGLRNFAKTNPQLVVKSGLVDGGFLQSAEISKLADLESREVLLAKLAGAMKGNLNKAAYLFVAPATKVARAANALVAKKESE
jgi:large subunit ribosomal protein L10